MTEQINNGELGLSVREKINTVLAGQFKASPTYAGPEIVVDGDLLVDPTTIDVPWFLDTGSTYSTGQIVSTYDGADLLPDFSIPIATVSGDTYLIVLHQSISGDVSGIYFDHNSPYLTSANDIAVLTFTANFTGDDSLWIDFDQYNSGATRTVTLVSLRHVNPTVNPLSVYGLDGTVLFAMGADPNNIAFSPPSLQSNTTGIENIGIGTNSLQSNTIGSENVAIGYGALLVNTVGNYNVVVGNDNLDANVNGSYNVAIGYETLRANIDGSYNIAVCLNALLSNTSGVNNIALGPHSLQASTVGNANIALGISSLQSNTEGGENIGIGDGALETNTTGSANIAIGGSADVGSGALTNAIAIGSGAVVSTSNTARIGNNSMTDIYFSAGTAIVHAFGDAIVFPDADPHIAGAAYWVAGVLTKSAG